jgi:hypothetical protein
MVVAIHIVVWAAALFFAFTTILFLVSAGPLMVETIMEAKEEWRRVFRKIRGGKSRGNS